MHRRWLATIVVILACSVNRSGAQPDDLGWIDFTRLDAGEVVLETTGTSRGTVHIDLAVAIDADWETIWDILKACEIAPEFVPNVVACRPVASIEDCNCELFEQSVKPAFFLPRFEHIFKLEYFPPERIEVSHVSGPLDQMDGSWRLIQRPGRTTVLIHSLTLKPGFPVPRLFVRNTLRNDLPKVLREVRERAEAARTSQPSASL
jgi:hypothetical protein